jgi:hypothetical protein
VPIAEADTELVAGLNQSTRDNTHSEMTSNGPRRDKCRSTSPRDHSSRPARSTRRHTDVPHGARWMPDPAGRSNDDAEEECVRAQLRARPRSPSDILWYRNPSTDKEHTSVGHVEDVASIPILHSRRQSPAKVAERSRSLATHTGVDVHSFLDLDSPKLTEDSIRRTLEASTQWQRDPRYTAPRSSAGSSTASTIETGSYTSGNSERDTEAQTSPELSVDGDIVSTTFKQESSNTRPVSGPDAESMTKLRPAPRSKQAKDKEHNYGTPEMPRGSANLPHLPPNVLTQRVPNPGQGHVKHLPRAEKLPLTGYELLAARLSTSSGRDTSRPRRHGRPQSSQPPSPASDSGICSPDTEPDIKPIYRRFEALNHRLLLHLQDELSELEEQLHRLDTADTQTRRLQNCILPASRRAESMSGGELQWHKTDILGKIGFKLGQYNHALSSFRQAQNLPSPDLADVETYRTYLATDNPIAEIETRFLDPSDDLVSLARDSCGQRFRSNSSSSSSSYGTRKGAYSPAAVSDEAPTPRQGSLASFLPKTTRFPFIGAAGGTFLPTPSLSPASSVAGSERPSTSASVNEVDQPEAPEKTRSVLRLTCILSAAAILLPVLLFRMIGGFAARLAVVLVLTSIAGVFSLVFTPSGRLEHPQGLLKLEGKDWLAYSGAYGAIIAVIAAVC